MDPVTLSGQSEYLRSLSVSTIYSKAGAGSSSQRPARYLTIRYGCIRFAMPEMAGKRSF